MKLLSVITAAALATVSFSAAAAPAGFVSYSCDGGKSLNVMYGFDRSGRAVTADVNAGGKKPLWLSTKNVLTALALLSPTAAAIQCLPVSSTKTPTLLLK